MMDYLGASYWDKSDGRSLRRYVEETSYNENFEERVVVAELEKVGKRDPPMLNFMVRHGDWKLMIPKRSDSGVIDMLFNIRTDPYEERNLIGLRGKSTQPSVVGKAEHLKILLWEYMKRNNGQKQYFSGLLGQIHRRRTWRKLNYWESTSKLSFSKPVRNNGDGGEYRMNAYLYIGRTTPGSLVIQNISVKGPHAKYFSLSKSSATIKQNGYIRVKVMFRSRARVWRGWDFGLQAYIEVRNNANGVRRIQLVGAPG